MTSGLCAAVLSAIVVGAASVPFRGQSPPSAALAGGPAPLDRATIEHRLDELLNAHMQVNRFSGAVLIASQGKPLVAKGYGYANVEWQIPNTNTTKFRIGSITKHFTSMLVMQLRERGRIKLEDFVCLYVSPCQMRGRAVTIHHPRTHTSGIPFGVKLADALTMIGVVALVLLAAALACLRPALRASRLDPNVVLRVGSGLPVFEP